MNKQAVCTFPKVDAGLETVMLSNEQRRNVLLMSTCERMREFNHKVKVMFTYIAHLKQLKSPKVLYGWLTAGVED